MAARRIRLGFIGAGWWATANHMPILAARPDVEMAAVCRIGQAQLGRVKERFGFGFATEDYRALLEEPLDAVIVTTPHGLHYEHARAALERGLHVMVEKPMALRATEAWALADIARRNGLHVLVPYGWNYKPFVAEARRHIAEGALGEIEYAMCHMASPIRGLLTGGDSGVTTDEGGAAGGLLFAPESATWADPAVAGGGYGQAQLTHSTGLLFFLTPLRAQRVHAEMTAPGSRVELYDAMSVRFENGAIGVVSGAGSVPPDSGFQVDVRIFGSEGMLLLDVERERLEVRRHDRRNVSVPIPPGEGAYSCDEPPNRFVDLVLGKDVANNSPAEVAARSVELLEAGYRSAASGQPEMVWR